MVSRYIRIANPTGLHLRPAGVFCDAAVRFKSSITFKHGNTTSNAKSILSVLGACIKSGDTIDLICEGEDEDEAMEYMVDIIENKLE